MKFTQSVKLLTSLVFLATSKIAYADEEEENQFKPSGPIASAQPDCEGLCFPFGSRSDASNQRFFVPVTENTFDVSIVKIEASGDLGSSSEYINYFIESGDGKYGNSSIQRASTGRDSGCLEEISLPFLDFDPILFANSFYTVVEKGTAGTIKPYQSNAGYGFWVNVDPTVNVNYAPSGCGNTNEWNLRFTIVENDAPPVPVVEDKCIPSKGTSSCEAVGGECVADCENNEQFVCLPELCSYDKYWDKERLLRGKEEENVVEMEVASTGDVNGRNLKGTKSPKASKAPKGTKAPKAAKPNCSCRVPNFTGYVLSEAPSSAPSLM